MSEVKPAGYPTSDDSRSNATADGSYTRAQLIAAQATRESENSDRAETAAGDGEKFAVVGNAPFGFRDEIGAHRPSNK